MCVGTIVTLMEVTGEGTGRLRDGRQVPLSFVPDAEPGAHLLLHLGIPVEVIEPEVAREALCLRAEAAARAGAAPGGERR